MKEEQSQSNKKFQGSTFDIKTCILWKEIGARGLFSCIHDSQLKYHEFGEHQFAQSVFFPERKKKSENYEVHNTS